MVAYNEAKIVKIMDLERAAWSRPLKVISGDRGLPGETGWGPFLMRLGMGKALLPCDLYSSTGRLGLFVARVGRQVL